jgi:hypothetical protein
MYREQQQQQQQQQQQLSEWVKLFHVPKNIEGIIG